MQVALITPTPLLERFATKSKYQFVLAHEYARSKAYREFYLYRRSVGDCIIVDNGAYEFGEAITFQELIDCVRDLRPQIAVLPDVRFDRKKTLGRTKFAFEKLRPFVETLIGVPQGNDRQDVLTCYMELRRFGVDGFGLYEEIGQVTGLGTRTDFLQFLEDNGYVDESKYYHLLGMEEDLTQIKNLAEFAWVDGIDSCKPLVYGWSGVRLLEDGTDVKYPHRPRGYFTIDVAENTLVSELMTANIDRVLVWAKAKEAK